MDDPPNVQTVRRAFELVAAGDMEGSFACWSPEIIYHAFDADGNNKECRGRDELLEMFAGLQRLFEHHDVEVVNLRGVGPELVVAELRNHSVDRKHRDHVSDYLIVLGVRDGLIQFAADFIDSSIQEFLDSAWS